MGVKCRHFGFMCGIILIGVLVFSAKPAFASYFDGGQIDVGNLGVSAVIETQNPYTAVNGSSSAWDASLSGYSEYQYTQVGWAKDYPMSAPKYFWEWSNSLTSWSGTQWLGTASSGSNNRFEVSWDSSTAYMRINGYDYGSVSRSNLSWSPGAVEVFGETLLDADQSPGSNSNVVSMGASYYKDTSGTWISSPNFYKVTYKAWQQNNIPSGGASDWSIWDNRF